MDFINEEDLEKKIVKPSLDQLRDEIIPSLLAGLEAKLRSVLDGAQVTVTINLKPRS